MIENQYVAVCALDAASLKKLARLGREIADRSGAMLKVMLFVGMQRQCEEHARMLEDVFQCAKNMDAEMNVFYTDRPMEKLMADGSECLVVDREEGLTEPIRQLMPKKRLVVAE